jgi:hypothetical protein
MSSPKMYLLNESARVLEFFTSRVILWNVSSIFLAFLHS